MENQFLHLKNWTHVIFNAIKKDIKTEHLGSDPLFYRKYFGNRPQNRLTTDEIFNAYESELLNGNDQLAAWVINRWVFKNGDLYQIFADRLSQINPDFDQIKNLTEEESQKILDGISENYGAIHTYLFVLLNGVVFPETVRDALRVEAEAERRELEKQESSKALKESLEKILAAKDREISRLHEKISGVQKKYDRNTEALKKQIKALQKK